MWEKSNKSANKNGNKILKQFTTDQLSELLSKYLNCNKFTSSFIGQLYLQFKSTSCASPRIVIMLSYLCVCEVFVLISKT